MQTHYRARSSSKSFANTNLLGAFLDHDKHDITYTYDPGDEASDLHYLYDHRDFCKESLDLSVFLFEIEVAHTLIVFGMHLVTFAQQCQEWLLHLTYLYVGVHGTYKPTHAVWLIGHPLGCRQWHEDRLYVIVIIATRGIRAKYTDDQILRSIDPQVSDRRCIWL